MKDCRSLYHAEETGDQSSRVYSTRTFRCRRIVAVCAAVSILLFAGTMMLYSQVRGHRFLHYDDHEYITGNPWVLAGLTLKGATWAVTSVGYASNWHPVTWFSHMLDVQLFGLSPSMHHLASAAIHAINAVILFLLLRLATGTLARSLFVAVLFAVHPLHVESVAWLSERKDVLSSFFGLLTVAAYLRHVRRPARWSMSVVTFLFTISLAAKPMLVTLPLLLLVFDFWPLGRIRTVQVLCADGVTWRSALSCRYLVVEKLPLFVLSAASSLLTLLAQRRGGALDALSGLPIEVRAANAMISLFSYLKLMLWPSRLAAIYPHPEVMPDTGYLVFVVVAISGITASALLLARRKPWLTFGWSWYLITLLPALGVIQVGMQAMADRYTYLALNGPFLVIVWWASGLRVKRRYAVLTILSLLLVGLLAWRSAVQISFWRDDITLFRHTLAVTAENFSAHNNLGIALGNEGRFEEASAEFSRAIAMRPFFSGPRYNLGLLQHRQGRLDEAAQQYQFVILAHPEFEPAHTNLGSILLSKGRPEDAFLHFQAALMLSPDDAVARQNFELALEAVASAKKSR